ncbi:MAG: hypothetical protein OEV94_08505 [Deltaproteobacteria bacterium]|nr:hypothetical protein [Deltaproteobacteria bacterium]
MKRLPELLARRTQLKNTLTETAATKAVRASVETEIEKLNQEIERYMKRNPGF